MRSSAVVKDLLQPSGILLACVFLGLLAGGMRHPAFWTAGAAVLWLTAIAFPISWARLAGFKAWVPWLCWAGLSQMASDQPLKCHYAFARWLAVIAFFGMACFHFDEKDRKRWLIGLSAAGLILGIATFFDLKPGYPKVGLIPPYYNYTMFVLAALFAGLLGALGRGSLGLWPRAGAVSLMAFALGVIVWARSRGALWAIGCAGGLWMLRRGWGKRLLVALAALAVLAALAPPRARIHVLKLDRSASFKRPDLWRAAWQVAWDHPILGEGVGNFEQGFMRHNFPAERATRFGLSSPYAHSEPLQTAAETGWVGFGLFIAALWFCVRAYPRPGATRGQEAAFCAVTAMAAHGAVDNMLQIPGLALLFFSALACAQPAVSAAAPEKDGARLWRAVCLGGLVLGLSAWIPQNRFASYLEEYWKERDPIKRLDIAQRAERIFPADYYVHELLARSWLNLVPPQMTHTLEEFEKAALLNPTNALYPGMLAELMRTGGRWEDAANYAAQAVALEPNYLDARLLLAEAHAALGRKDSAREELEQVLRRKPELERAEINVGYDRVITSFNQSRYLSLNRSLSK